MELKNLMYMQDEIRKQIGKAVCRLNAQGAEISRTTILQTLNDFMKETDDKEKQRLIESSINMFIVTNGQFEPTLPSAAIEVANAS